MSSRGDAGDWLAVGALAGAGLLCLLVCRRTEREQEPSGEGQPEGESSPVLLHPPVRLPLRRISPNGAFGAPRYVVGRASSAIPPYPGASVHHLHQGIDLRTSPGEAVYAVGRGRIVPVRNPGFGGKVVKLLLDDGRAVVYASLSAVLVVPGERVGPLTEIGRASRRGIVHIAVRASEHGPYLDAGELIPNAGLK